MFSVSMRTENVYMNSCICTSGVKCNVCLPRITIATVLRSGNSVEKVHL